MQELALIIKGCNSTTQPGEGVTMQAPTTALVKHKEQGMCVLLHYLEKNKYLNTDWVFLFL